MITGRRWLSRLGMSASMLLLTACGSNHPLGISEEQWNQLTVEQQFKAHQQQTELDQAAEIRREAQAQAQLAETQRRQAELDLRRQTAAYGDRVQCVLSDAQARLGGSSWRSVEPIAFDLVTGLPLSFDLLEQTGSSLLRRTSGVAQFDGQTVSLCRADIASRRDERFCARLLGNQADYRRGLSQRIESRDFVRGHLRCNLVLQGQTLRR